MTLTFKPSIPDSNKVERIVDELNQLNITTSSEFITTVPRHHIIIMDIDTDDPQTIFEIGILIGTLDSL